MLVTKFINESEVEVLVPLMKEANHRWLALHPQKYGRNFYDFKNQSDKDLYARYDLIRFVKDPSTKYGYSVQAHVRDGWREPKNPGLTLVVENFKADTHVTISTPDWGIPAPFQMRLVFYNISAFDFTAEVSKLETVPEIVERVTDSWEPGGYREIRRGGGIKRTPRPVEELLLIKRARKGKNQDLSFEAEERIKEFEQQQKKEVKKTKTTKK